MVSQAHKPRITEVLNYGRAIGVKLLVALLVLRWWCYD